MELNKNEPMTNPDLTIINIQQLVGELSSQEQKIQGDRMNHINCIENAYISIKDGLISGFGAMKDLTLKDNDKTYDANNKMVLP